jgi:ABC-2 type transport system ATP-binding protein
MPVTIESTLGKVGIPLVMRTTMIGIDGLAKHFPVRRSLRAILLRPRQERYIEALRDFTCAIGQGEFFGLLGPNGAGKSTLFKLLATLVLPDSGTATIAGHDLRRDANRVRSIVGFVNTEERSLNWRLSARENLRFYASMYGMRGASLRTRVEEVLTTVELATTGDQMVGQFSSGMRQRLLIARSLLPRPRILLLDEPTRSLDPIAARRFRQFLRRELVEREGCTVLLATHNADEAMTLCDRVGILDHGRLLALGSVQELSRDVVGNQVQLRTRTPHHRAFQRLADAGTIRNLVRLSDADGWELVRFTTGDGDDRSAEIVTSLVGDGVVLSAFHRVQPTLADIIESIVHRQGAP